MSDPRALTPTSEFRALTIFEDLPVGHKAVLVQHHGFEPHIKLNEYAVVDMSDKEPIHGELYMIWIESPRGPHLRIIQHVVLKTPDVGIRWRYALPKPGLHAFSDGPLGFEYWRDKCLGRVVGVFEPLATVHDLSSSYMSLPSRR